MVELMKITSFHYLISQILFASLPLVRKANIAKTAISDLTGYLQTNALLEMHFMHRALLTLITHTDT